MTEKTEKGKKAVTSGKDKQTQATSGSQQASGQGFVARFQKLYSDFDELRKEGAGIQAYDDICSQLINAKKELEDGKQEISGLQTEIKRLRGENESVVQVFEGRYKTWDTVKNQHEKNAEELDALRDSAKRDHKAAIDARQRSDQLQQEADKHKRQVKDLKKDKSDLQEEVELIDLQLKKKGSELKKKGVELNKCRETLQELRTNLGLQPLDVEATRERFERLANGLHDLVWNHFNRTIPNSGALIDVSGSALSWIPQVASESKVAQCIRCAFAEAVIAQQLSASIFQDVYLVDDTAKAHLKGLILALEEWLDAAHPLPATIIRCQIAKISDGSRKVKEVPGQAASAVRSILSPWLHEDQTQEELFTQGLEGLFADALKLWQRLQRTRQRAYAVTDPSSADWDPEEDAKPHYDGETLREGDGRSQQQTPQDTYGFPIGVLFPKIFMVNDNQDNNIESGDYSQPLFHGFALFSTQGAVLAARSEGAPRQTPQRSNTNAGKRRSLDYGRRGTGPAPMEMPQSRGPAVEAGGGERSYSRRTASQSSRARETMTESLLSMRSQRSGSGVGSGVGSG
ncbi:hypothetical protein G7Z17_g7116 [Cylindrodendrum hubeiense]|uniref:Uncharacterized protein n=1 Tax=Cylindrodendrum hubeiense TaxID=595255 RepID=A0A9P5H9N8_9HYPO|nr:hypothetical protein G7Z17_g7116 [Cylindrodendrum hubeiense]